MGDGTRIGNPGNRQPQPIETNTANVEPTLKSSIDQSGKMRADTGTTVRTPRALKQQGIETKGQQSVSGSLKQKELHDKFRKDDRPTSWVSPNATSGQLGKINVQREKNKDGSIVSQYPNGVTINRSFGSHPSNKVTVSSHSVLPPPGGKLVQKSDHEMDVLDAKGKIVGTVITTDKDLTVRIRTKEGDYTERPDGSITFAKNRSTTKA